MSFARRHFRKISVAAALAATGLGFPLTFAADAPPGGGSSGSSDSKLAAVPAQVNGTEITPAQEDAVAKGLAFLASQQKADGTFGGDDGTGAAVSALAGLAWMANGNLPGRGKYGENVRRILNLIVRTQQESGYLVGAGGSGNMYGHGFATLFLGEVYGMTSDEETKENLQRAVRLIERSQNPQGGWRYTPSPMDADISVTICQVMALRAARDAGIHIDGGVMDKAIQYVRDCQNPDGGFSYMAHQNGGSGFARTAAGTASLYYAGVFGDNAVTKGLDYLSHFGNGGASDGMDNQNFFYGNYYATQAMFLAGGKYWSTFYPSIRDRLIQRQDRNSGSWSGETNPQYCTAMALIILQMPNRYLPVFNGKGPGS